MYVLNRTWSFSKGVHFLSEAMRVKEDNVPREAPQVTSPLDAGLAW